MVDHYAIASCGWSLLLLRMILRIIMWSLLHGSFAQVLQSDHTYCDVDCDSGSNWVKVRLCPTHYTYNENQMHDLDWLLKFSHSQLQISVRFLQCWFHFQSSSKPCDQFFYVKWTYSWLFLIRKFNQWHKWYAHDDMISIFQQNAMRGISDSPADTEPGIAWMKWISSTFSNKLPKRQISSSI